MNISASGNGYSAAMMPPMRMDPAQLAEQLFSSADADGDGSISKSELSSIVQGTNNGTGSDAIDTLFSQMDSDGDGSISSQENQDAIDNLFAQMRQAATPPGDMPPPPPPPDANEFMSNADTDGDGSLSLEEFSAGMLTMGDASGDETSRIESMFNEADSNGDGSVSAEELQAAMEAHRPPPPPPPEQNAESSTDNSTDQVSALIQALLNQYTSGDEESNTLSVTA